MLNELFLFHPQFHLQFHQWLSTQLPVLVVLYLFLFLKEQLTVPFENQRGRLRRYSTNISQSCLVAKVKKPIIARGSRSLVSSHSSRVPPIPLLLAGTSNPYIFLIYSILYLQLPELAEMSLLPCLILYLSIRFKEFEVGQVGIEHIRSLTLEPMGW